MNVDRPSSIVLAAMICFGVSAGYNAQDKRLRQSPIARRQQMLHARRRTLADRRSPLDDRRWTMPHRAVLNKYCTTCHNSRAKVGGLALDAVDTAKVGDHADVWENVVRKVRTGAMPPVGRPRPDKVQADGLVAYLETSLDRYATEHPNPGRPSLHRLNRTEYTNAIRDMLGLEIDAAALLPADNAAYGFDNVADALGLSPALTERYLGAAAKISQMALARVKDSPLPETFLVPTDRNQGVRVNDDLPFGSRGGLAIRYYFPVDGEYKFEMRLKEDGAGGGVQGLTDEPHQLEARVDDAKVWDVTIGGPAPAAPASEAGAAADPNLRPVRRRALPNLTFSLPVKAGTHVVGVYFVNKTTAYLEDLFDMSQRRDPYRAGNGEPVLSSVTITAPGGAGVAASDSPSRRKLLTCSPTAARSAAAGSSKGLSEEACAKQVLGTIARLAYRRPVAAEDMEIPLKLYRDAAAKGGFESGTRARTAQHPRESEVPVPVRKPARRRRGEHTVSHLRSRAGVAALVLPVEQHPGR